MKNKKQHPNGYRKISIWKNFWILLVVMLLFTTFLGGRINVKAAAKTFTSSEVADYFNKQVGKSYPSGMCLKFVADSFGNLGADRSSTCCAYKYGSSHITSKNIDNIPVGADVFFGACGGGPCKTCKSSYYGHIGVYVGDGYFVHATGGKVQKTSLKGTNWKNKYRGWGYHGNVNISQSTSGNNKPESGQQPILSCLDFPEDGRAYSETDKIVIQGWFITPDGVACVNAGKAEGSDLVQCSMYSRPDVSNLYPGYPTGSEGFRVEATPAQLQLTPGSNTIVIRGYSKNGQVVEIGKRTINYEPNFFHIDTPAKDLNSISTTSDIYGWVISKKGISKLVIVLNDVEYEITNRFQRPDVAQYHPGYDVSKAGFSYQIDPTKFRNGMNSLKVRAYTSSKDYFEIYNGMFEGIKMWEGYFDSDYYYARYKDSDVDVRNIGQNEEKLKYHYYTAGIEKGYSPCISFDAKYYKENNGDLRDKSYKFVYEHFVRFVLGNGEIRPLSPWLHLGFYRDHYRDELGSMDSKTLVTHHKVYGSREGRLGAPTQEAEAFCKLYNPIRYAGCKGNEDVRNAFGDGSTNESRDLLWFHFWYYVLGGSDEHQASDEFCFNYVKKTYNLKTNMDAFWWYMDTGYSQKLDTVQKTEVSHVHTLEKTEAQPASCVKSGNREYWTCTNTDCNKVYADADAVIDATVEMMSIPKTEHTWDEGIVTKEPLGMKTGIKTYTCSECGKIRTEEIAATGKHMLVKVEEQPAGCIENGTREHWRCTDCGILFADKDASTETTVEELEISCTGHVWDEGEVSMEPAADQAGMKVYTCTVCGSSRLEEVSLPGETHKLSKVEKKAANCTNPGHEAYWICTDCGKVFEDAEGKKETSTGAMEIPKTAHAWDGGKVIKEPSISTLYTCIQCGTTKKQEIPPSGGGHILSKVAAKKESCLENGNKEHWSCTDCGMLFADKDARTETTAEAVTIPQKPHNWDKGEVLKEPTSTEKGIKILRCTICGWTEVEKISSTGGEGHNHKLVKVEEKDAECLTPGNKAYWLCEDCGKMFKDKDAGRETTAEAVTVRETGHAWDKGKVTKEPTAKKKGEKTFHCVVCGGIKTETIPELDEEDDMPEVGDRLIDEDTNNIYLVTHMGPQKKEVSYFKPGKKSASTVKIPSVVTIGGCTYKVVSIAPKAFANNKKLKKAVIQGNVETIGKQAFSGCTKLKSVTLGTKIHSIGDKAFFQCTALEKFTIPSKVSTIGKQAFYKCKKMKSVTIKTAKLTSKKIGYQAFKGLPSKVVVKVPKGKLNTYKKILIAKGLSKKAKIKR